MSSGTRTASRPPQPPPKHPGQAIGAVEVAAIAIGAAILLVLFSNEVADFDIWIHLNAGRYFVQKHAFTSPDPFAWTTAMGNPPPAQQLMAYFNVTHEWLAAAILYLIYAAAGIPGLVLAKAVTLTATCGLVGLVCYRRSGRVLRSVVAAFATSQCMLMVAERPYLVTYLLIAVTIALLEYRRWLWALPPLFLFWANCHSGFFLGWIVLGAYCAEALFLRWRGQPVADGRKLWLVTAISCLATAINPNGLRVFQVLLLYRQSPVQSAITEWLPPSYWELSPFTILLYGGLAALAWARKRTRISDWILFALFGTAAMMAVRNTVLLGLIGPIVLLSSIRWSPVPELARLAVTVVVLVFVGRQIAYIGGRFGIADWQFPDGAADFLLQHKVTGRMLNSHEMGGYLAWRLWPQQRVFVDGRVLNEETYLHYQRMAYNADSTGGPDGQELLRRYGIEAIVLPLLDTAGNVFTLPAALADPTQKEWKLVYRDAKSVVFMRSPPAGVQPMESAGALQTMEEQCFLQMEKSRSRGCANSIARVWAVIGDRPRAERWMREYRMRDGTRDSMVVRRP